jgi:hypothetical protein
MGVRRLAFGESHLLCIEPLTGALALKVASQTLLQSGRCSRPCRPPNPKLVAAGAYDLKDREIAAEVDAIASAISVRREGGLLIAEAERNDLQPAS